MAGKGSSTRSASKSAKGTRVKGAAKAAALPAAQRLARRKATSYFEKLGLRRLAKRLEARVTDVRKWLATKFPANKLPLALALDRPGGLRVTVKGSKIGALVEHLGKRGAADLTGLSRTEINEKLRRPGSSVSVNRDKLRKLIERERLEGARIILGATPKNIRAANTTPLTKATERLAAFTKEHGNTKTARYLGISEKQLTGWLKKSIPFAWEALVNSKLGRPSKNTPSGPSPESISRARPATPAQISSALAKARRWNAKVPRRYRLNLKEAERWARSNTFATRFRNAQAAYEASKKPLPPSRPQPPPTPPKRPPVIPPTALTKKPGKPKKPKRPPKRPPTKPPGPPVVDQFLEAKKRNFLQARSEAFLEGRYPEPLAPWGRTKQWKLQNRKGIHVYKKVEQFVHLINLDNLKKEMVAIAMQTWRQLRGEAEQMTIRCVFSAMGKGNPFYPDAFQEGDDVNFFTTNIYIRPSDEPEKTLKQHISDRIAEKLQEIYVVDAEDVLLFWEYYEVVKSVLI